jgi:hypothetical protein
VIPPVTDKIGEMASEPAQRHRLGVRLEVEIGIGRDGVEHLAGLRALSVELCNQCFLCVHSSNLLIAHTA